MKLMIESVSTKRSYGTSKTIIIIGLPTKCPYRIL